MAKTELQKVNSRNLQPFKSRSNSRVENLKRSFLYIGYLRFPNSSAVLFHNSLVEGLFVPLRGFIMREFNVRWFQLVSIFTPVSLSYLCEVNI